MTRDHDPFHAAVSAILERLEDPASFGAPISAAALAQSLGLSPTPVREALARLAGEGLLEHLPLKGYFAPRPDAGTLQDLIALHHRLILWALERHVVKAVLPPAPDDPVLSCEAVFAAIADAPRRQVLSQAQRRVALQLRPARRLEVNLRADWGADIEALNALIQAGDAAGLRAAVDAFHRQAATAAESVVARLPSPIDDRHRVLFE
jgi:DNA-binding GntR family transcriptional regulator